jgi:hypothetical protein
MMDETRSKDEIFVVRLWYEPSRSGAVMRGQVHHPVSGQRRYFSNLGELCDFITNAQEAHRPGVEGAPWRLP